MVNPCIYQCFHAKFQGVCLLEDLLKPSGGVGMGSLVIFIRTEADWNTGPKITFAALLKKNIPTWKKIFPSVLFWGTTSSIPVSCECGVVAGYKQPDCAMTCLSASSHRGDVASVMIVVSRACPR